MEQRWAQDSCTVSKVSVMTGYQGGAKGTGAEQPRHSGEVSDCQHSEEVGVKSSVCAC